MPVLDSRNLTSGAAPDRATIQARLGRLWSATLRTESIGLDDDFFEIGGDSLLAAELQMNIDTEFGVEIAASVIFRSPTIAALAETIESALAAGPGDLPHGAK